jgi:MFS-type transporter involved in bile tolerance (Atg22 family)
LPAFFLSTLFMLPILLRFKEIKQPIVQATENVYKKTRKGIKQLRTTHKNTWLYLLAFSLISDVVLTMTLYLAVVMDAVYRVNDNMKSLILIIFLVLWIISGYILWKLADKFGYKKLIIWTCIMLVITCVIFFSFSSHRALYTIGIVWWAASGWYFVLTRAFMIKLSPTGELWEYFWLYSTFQKAASITAPLIWWWITLRLIQFPVIKYQVAWRAMTILLIIWSILMYKVKEPK